MARIRFDFRSRSDATAAGDAIPFLSVSSTRPIQSTSFTKVRHPSEPKLIQLSVLSMIKTRIFPNGIEMWTTTNKESSLRWGLKLRLEQEIDGRFL